MKFLRFFINWRRSLPVLAAASLFSACTYKTEIPPTCAAPTATTVSYKKDVLPILTTDCSKTCHNSVQLQGNFDMGVFEQVKYWSTTEKTGTGIVWMLGNIRHDAGFSAMPQVGDKLDDCEIATIKAWIDAGAPNN